MQSITPIKIHKVSTNQIVYNQDDLLAVEEPLEIRIGFGDKNHRQQKSISVTMRTPRNDFELVIGFLISEGIITHYSDIQTIKYCTDLGKQIETENIVRVELKEKITFNSAQLERNFYASSSCGICGKASIETLETMGCQAIPSQPNTINSTIFFNLPKIIQQTQIVFNYTGGLHAASLFNTQGELIYLREDIGRHNALDKLIGASFMNGIDTSNTIALMSGRVGFEIVQKSIMARIPVLVAIGAPSSLAVNLARQYNLTLIGFLKSDNYNVYSGIERIKMNE